MVTAFQQVAEVVCDPARATVYEEGWQSWSPAGAYRGDGSSPRPQTRREHVMGWRAEKPLPDTGFQAEGLAAVGVPGASARAWVASDPGSVVPSIRIEARRDRLVVASDGPVDEVAAATLADVLAAVGGRLRVPRVRSIPPGWSSWSYYFDGVTEADVAENVEAAGRLRLPVEVVQVDDGWQAGIGDWLDVSPLFGSLAATAQRVLAAGATPGIWTAPFLVGARSRLALAEPDWLVGGAHAGENWGQRLLVLDVTHPQAAEHLGRVYRRLAELGFGFHKLDFLYAGALPGRRYVDCSPEDAYREGLRIVRDAVGGATLLGCGAPLLPSIGHVEAMRVGPDVIGREPAHLTTSSIVRALATTSARSWMHGRLWANDPDHLLARPEIPARRTWAAHVAQYGGVALSGDRLAALDRVGVELTRAALVPSSTRPVDRRFDLARHREDYRIELGVRGAA